MTDKLAQLRRLNSLRTKGPWVTVSSLPLYAIAVKDGDVDVVSASGREYRRARAEFSFKHGCRESDAEFIAAMANAAGALIEVAEAARNVDCCGDQPGICMPKEFDALSKALAKLEDSNGQ